MVVGLTDGNDQHNECDDPRYRGKRSYNPLLCIEANSSYLWDTELRPGNASTWDGSVELMATCFLNVPHDIRESPGHGHPYQTGMPRFS